MSSVIYYPGYAQTQVHQNLEVKTISAITNSYPMTLTTTEDTDYVEGMIVSFLIPKRFGMEELNEIQAQVLTVSANVLTIDVDSTNFSTFAYPGQLPTAYTFPSIIPYSSGPYLPPLPLPYGNQNSFQGVIYNAGV